LHGLSFLHTFRPTIRTQHLQPITAVLGVYVVIVALSFGRGEVPFAIQLSVAIVGALLTLVVSAVLIEMILCHYDRYACINL